MFQYVLQNDNKSSLKVIGSMRYVIEGRVTAQVLQSIHQEFRFALGAGTFSDIYNLGEALVFGSKGHISWVHDGQLLTKTSSTLSSPFLVGIDSKQPMGAYAVISSPLSVQALYEMVLSQYTSGFAIVGYGVSSDLHTTYMKKSTIYGESFLAKNAEYTAAKTMTEKQGLCFFGIAMPPDAIKKMPPEQVERVFYINPQERVAPLFQSHTHMAFIQLDKAKKDPDNFFECLQKMQVTQVAHLLTQTTLDDGAFALFPLS